MRAKRFAIFVLAVVAASSITTNPNFDTPWYLRSGDEILRTHHIPAQDTFSYTSPHRWMNHEWLSEVSLALVHRVGGVYGLGLLQALLVAATLAVLLLGRRDPERGEGLPGLAPLAYLVGALVLRESATPRAQSFSELLFALTLAPLGSSHGCHACCVSSGEVHWISCAQHKPTSALRSSV